MIVSYGGLEKISILAPVKPRFTGWDPDISLFKAPQWMSRVFHVKACLGFSVLALQGFPDGSAGKESTCNTEDTDSDSIPGSRRFPGEGNDNPLQYSCLGNPMDREEPGRLQFMGTQRVGQDLATETTTMSSDVNHLAMCLFVVV